jgi:pilus assembly protein CpaB
MLRRNVKLAEVVSTEDEEPEPMPEPAESAPVEAPAASKPLLEPLPRVPPSLGRPAQLDTTTLRIDPRPVPRRGGMEALRAEALQSVISRVEDRNFGGLRERFNWKRHRIGPRLVLGVIALGAGGLAAYMSVNANTVPPPAPPPEPAVVAAPSMVQVLVASDAIPAGHKVTVASLGWQDWPEAAVRPEYITALGSPEAPTDLSGFVARTDILPGEPIRQEKLVAGGESLLASMLAPGMRAVSATVSAEAASGGFVTPNDRVDVVLTKATATGQASDTILYNVRVLAINTQIGNAAPTTPAPEVGSEAAGANATFGPQAIATLELDPLGAEVLINATSAGRLSLVLRPAGDETGPLPAQSAANQAIRLSSPFWTK